MYLRTYICMSFLLVSTDAEISREIIFKNQMLKKICSTSDAYIEFCRYSVCRGNNQRVLPTDPSAKINNTHWSGSIQILTPGSLNCFSRITSRNTSTIYVSLYELNNTVVEPSGNPIKIEEGETLRVNCSVESVPDVTLTWVTPRGDITVNNALEDKLLVENATVNDTGVYQCSAYNDPLRLRSTKYFNVSVLCKPRPYHPRIYPGEIWFVPGQTIHLKAMFIANPPPEFSWKKKTGGSSHTIENDKRVTTIKTASLVELKIRDTVETDQGLYLVVATNRIGADDLYFDVYLNESNQSTTPSEEVEADTEDEMTSLYIGAGVGIGVFALLIVVVTVFICRRRRQRPPANPRTTEIEPKNKKPKSLNELAKRKPALPPRKDKQEVPRYSTQFKMKKRGGNKGHAPEENYDETTKGDGALYQQDMYEDLQTTEYYNH